MMHRIFFSKWVIGHDTTENVAVTTSWTVAQETGKRHNNIAVKIQSLIDDDPRVGRHFRRVDGETDARPRYWFEMDEAGTRLLFSRFHNEPGRFSVKQSLNLFLQAFADLEADRFLFAMRKFGCTVLLDGGQVRISHPPDVYVARRWWDVIDRYGGTIAARLPRPLRAQDVDADLFDPAAPQPVDLPSSATRLHDAPSGRQRRRVPERGDVAADARADAWGRIDDPDDIEGAA